MSATDEITVIKVGSLGAPGTGITPTEYASLDSDRNALLARANITGVAAIPGVVLTALADGQVLAYQASSGHWINVANLEAVKTVKNNSSVIMSNADTLNWSSAFAVTQDGTVTTQADIAPVFGTTSTTFAVGNHVHNAGIVNRWTFAATGLLSSGSRTLATNTSTVLVNGVTYDWHATFVVTGRNNVNNGTVTLSFTIAGSTMTRTLTTVGGVPHEMTIPHAGVSVGTGAGITVTASIAYGANDPTNVDDGWVTFNARPRN